MVYVISKNGEPLMPTKRHAKVRILLKQKKARVVALKPFTIQLLYDTTIYTQCIVAGYDPGRTHLSITALREENGEVLNSSEMISRNKEVPKLMMERKMHRMIRRHSRRMKKIRRAKRHGTYFRAPKQVKQPGTEEPITVKYIMCKQARFNNRKRPEGWLTPTARQLLQTHINYLKKIMKILPIKKLVLEYAQFNIQKIVNPDIKGEQYQRGELYGYANLKEYIKEKQKGKCLLCGKNPIEHLHHIKPKSEGGSDTYKNIAGLCSKCHDKVHKDEKAKKKLEEKKKGLEKEYNSMSMLNTIMPYLYEEIKTMLDEENVRISYGYETEITRKELRLDKTHYNDSYAMALMEVKHIDRIERIEPYIYKQYRRHNRQICDAERDRLYKSNGKIVARNRRKKTEQKEPSLKEYRGELTATVGKKEAARIISKLKVYTAVKRINSCNLTNTTKARKDDLMTFEEVLQQALKKYEKQKGKKQIKEELEQYLLYAEAEKRRYGIKFKEGV